jgi:hypothetical protein
VFLGTCPSCPRPVRFADDTAGDYLAGSCPDCATPVKAERLYGTVTRMTCAPACMGAYGPNCECACGGINHGGTWSEPGHMLAGELAAYRAGVARREAERQARADKERGRKQRAFDAWRADGNDATVTALLATDWEAAEYPNGFLADLASQLRRLDPLTPRQVDAAAGIVAKRAAAAARDAARKATATEVPAGRQAVTGTVVAKWWKPGYMGEDVLQIKVDTGTWQVRGTCPRALMVHTAADGTFSGADGIKAGDRVTFTAELRPDGQETGQGYFKRPTKPAFA